MKIKKIFIWIPVLFGILIVNSCKDGDDNNVKTEICNNGLDDDGDGQIDCDDSDCANYSGCLAVSDFRLKNNIATLNYGLDEILQLDAKIYTYKTDNNIKRMGFIAQDVQKIMPELVSKNKTDDYLNFKYMDLIAVLVNAVQEQQEIIEANQQQIEVLTAQIENQKVVN
ncbi:MAG: tail fiber domain-containing protein [Chitinophagales bacterium]|nr:tail fiber domain-containing protein [Chitinophagales bacterium]